MSMFSRMVICGALFLVGLCAIGLNPWVAAAFMLTGLLVGIITCVGAGEE